MTRETTGRVQIDLFSTLDGMMQAPGGPDEDPSDGFAFGGWQAPIDDDLVGERVIAGSVAWTPFCWVDGRTTSSPRTGPRSAMTARCRRSRGSSMPFRSTSRPVVLHG